MLEAVKSILSTWPEIRSIYRGEKRRKTSPEQKKKEETTKRIKKKKLKLKLKSGKSPVKTFPWDWQVWG